MKITEYIENLLASDKTLEAKRSLLKDQSYSSACPTSKAATDAYQCYLALGKFDVDHPEIKAAILAKEATQAEADHEDVKKLGWI